MSYTIIYQTKNGAQTDFESQYLNDWLLNEIPKKILYDNATFQTIEPNAILIYSTNRVRLSPILEGYIKKLANPLLVHLSNEGQNHNGKYYRNVKAVFRTAGWNPTFSFSNVFTMPLGFQSGYLNDNLGNLENYRRDLVWVFAGAIKQDRLEMLSLLEEITPNWHFKSMDWGGANSKTTLELIEYYQRSIFAPSPFGNINHECFRTMESLEWGCIPVTTFFLGEDCYKYIYGDHPFIVGENWGDAANQMKYLLENPTLLKERQQKVWNWYRTFKEELQGDVGHIIEGNFDIVKGVQFKYQRQSKNNWKLRWRFFKHFTLNVYWKRLLGRSIKSNNG